ncbi:MAG: replication-relaxation family protein [Thermaerobacter sp.]|nr:replication-relaxation family protein [Thermaerobacter sp.]
MKKTYSTTHWDRSSQSAPTLNQIFNNPAFRGQERDFDILIAALRYNYLTPRQVAQFTQSNLRGIQRRLNQLHAIGLLDRTRYSYRQDPYAKVRKNGDIITLYRPVNESVYALSPLGMEYLVWGEEPLAIDWQDDWRPKTVGYSRKLSMGHELARNDVCLAMMAEAEQLNRPMMDWMSSREGYARLPATSNGHATHIEPDAVLLLDTGRPLLVEYERSGRSTKYHAKIRNFRRYLAGGYWKEQYALEPWVVYAVAPGLGTQQTPKGSYNGLIEAVQSFGARRYLVLNDDAWREGQWKAANSEGRLVNFWETVWGKDYT